MKNFQDQPWMSRPKPRASIISVSKTALGCTHEVAKLLFSMLSSILTFDFDLILGSFRLFGALMG